MFLTWLTPGLNGVYKKQDSLVWTKQWLMSGEEEPMFIICPITSQWWSMVVASSSGGRLLQKQGQGDWSSSWSKMLQHECCVIRRDPITPVLASLHWFLVKFWIEFKILLTYKALNNQAPSYIFSPLFSTHLSSPHFPLLTPTSRPRWLPTMSTQLLIVGTVGFPYKKCQVLTFNEKCIEIMYIMIWRLTNII